MAEISKQDVVEYLSNMRIKELADFVKELEDLWGVEAAVGGGAVMVAGGGGTAEVVEQTEFDVILRSYGDKKIQVIKTIREITGLGLKEAKGLVESAPVPVKEGIAKDAAEEIITKLEAAGASAEIK